MHGRSCLLTGLIALSIPATAGAATLPARTVVGPAQGVTATAKGKTLTLGFTGAAAAWGKAHAGGTIEVDCATTPAPGRLLFVKQPTAPGSTEHGSGEGHVAADGASARIELSGAPGDSCAVNGAPTWELPPSSEQAYAALTPAGASYVDAVTHGLRMADVIYGLRPHGVYASAADAVALGGGEVVALDDPNGTPPAGKIGYWSKGRAVSVIAADSTGRRLEIQDLGGGMLRTNAFEGLLAWSPVKGRQRTSDASSSFGGDDSDSSEGSTDEDGVDDDVHARLSGDRVVFTFTGSAAKLYRRYAGRRVHVACVAVPARPLLGEATVVDPHPARTTVRVPRHGGVIRGAAPAGHRDLCAVETLSGRDLADGVLTAAGRRYMYDMVAPLALAFADNSPLELAEAGATRYPGVATLVASHPGLVGLATPGAPLKVGDVGVWTDADQQAVVVTAAPGGLRYVLADEGHGTTRTNLYAGLLGLVATVVQDSE
jgi:hypothetical protein